MKAVILKENKTIFTDITEPQIKTEDDVKIKVISVGLCGSDIHKILRQAIPNYMKINVLGHEVAGIVCAIGKDVHDIAVGDFVCVEPIFPKKYEENYQFFQETKFLGRDIQGAFAEYIVVPKTAVFNLLTNVEPDIACLTDVVAVALHAIHRCIDKPVKVAVIGDGTIALALITLCSLIYHCYEILCIGINENKLKIAEKLGATKTCHYNDISSIRENHYDVIFEAVGGKQDISLTQAINLCKPIGKIGVLGVFDPKFFNTVQLRNAFYKELSIIGINSYSMWKGKREFEEALEIIEKNLNVFSQLISCREPLSNFNKLIQYISEKKQPMPIKVVFHP